jgi:hypothetical protein
MEFLLVTEQEVTAGKAAGAFGAFKWLLFRVRPLMSLEMLQTRKRA